MLRAREPRPTLFFQSLVYGLLFGVFLVVLRASGKVGLSDVGGLALLASLLAVWLLMETRVLPHLILVVLVKRAAKLHPFLRDLLVRGEGRQSTRVKEGDNPLLR